MDDIRTIFENLNNNDPDTVRKLFRAALNERMYRRLGMEHIDTTFRLWEEGDEVVDAAAAAVGTPDDTVLDPAYEKEYFLKTFEVKNNTITLRYVREGTREESSKVCCICSRTTRRRTSCKRRIFVREECHKCTPGDVNQLQKKATSHV
jgi:hypothetical protein